MDISTNELKQPFRIPRRKAEDNKPRDNEQVHRKRATPEIRSPLVASSSQKKADSAFSSRIIPPSGKRRSSLDRNSGAKRSANGKQPSGGEVFDRIIGNMVNPPKERKNELQKDREETGPSGPSSANRQQQQRSTGARQLTREELDRLHFDNSACYEFLRKDGLMERLLGHKMLNGRVDSHVTLGYVACNPRDIPSRQRLNYGCGAPVFDDFPVICEPPPVAALGIDEQRPRGPRTPPGSPGCDENSSLLSSRGAESVSAPSPTPVARVHSSSEQCVSKAEANASSSANNEPTSVKEANRKSDLLSEMAELTKLPHNQLAECLGEELQNAMKQVDHSVLLNTLKDALMKVGKTKSSVRASSPTSRKRSKGNIYGEEKNTIDVSSRASEMDIESEKSEEEELLRPPPVAPPAMNDRIIDTMPQGAAPPSAVLPFPPPPPRAIAEPPSPSPPPPPPPPPPSFPVVNLSSALAPPQPPAISHASPYESMSAYPIPNTGFPPLQNAPDVHGNLMSHASNINCALPYSSQSVSAQQTLSSATPTLTVASAPPPFAPPVPPLILSSSIAVPIPRSSSPPVAATMKSSSSAIPQNPYASTTSIPPTHLMPPPPVPSVPPVPSSFSLSATGATPSSAFISLSNSSAIVRPSISSLPPLPAHMQPSCGIPLHTQDLQTKMEFPENFTPLNSTDSVQENILKRRGAESAGVPYSVCVTSSMPVAVTVASSASFGYNVLQSHKRPLISSALPNISSSSQTPEACPKSLPGPPPVPLRAWLNSSSALSTSAGSSNQIGTTLSSGLQSVPNLIMSSPLQADSRPHFTPITPILSTTSVFPLPSSSANSSSPFSLPQSSFPSANMNSVSLAYVTTAGTHTSGTIVTQSYSSLNLNDEKYGNSPSNCAAAIHFARPPPVISDAQRFSITNQTHPTGLLESTQIQRKSQSYSATVFMENDHLKGRQQLADDNRAGFGSFVSATESVQQRPTSPVSSPITTLPSSHTVMQTLFSALAIPRARPNNKPIESSSSQPQGGLASGFLTLSNPMTSSLSPSKLPSVASSQSAFSTSQSGMNTTATSSEVPGVHSTHGVSILGATTGSSALFDRYRYTFPGPGEFRYQERQPLQQHSFPPTSSAKSATNEEDTLDFSWPPAGFDQEDEQTVRKQGAEPVHRTLLGNRRGTYRGRWGFRARGRGNHNGSEGSRGIRRDDRFGRDSGPRRGGQNFERNLKGNRQRKVDREEAVFSEACGNKCHDTGGGVISFDDLNHKCPQDSHDGNEKQMLEPDASKEEGSSTLVTPVEEPAKVVGDEACDEEPGVPPDSALSEINENSKTGGEASTLKENSSEVNQISSRQSSEVKQSSPEVCHGGSTQEASATTADSSPAKVTTTEETEKPKFISYPRGKHSKFRQRPLPVVGCRGGIMCASESAATYNRPPISLKASMPLRAIPPYRPPPPFPGFLPARMRLPHPPPPRIPLRFPPPARFPPRFHPPEKLSFFR